jgi:uncharacterized protein
VTTLIDTGPLVSAFARRETNFKRWAEEILSAAPLPLVTCEPVITEACHMLGSADRILEAIERKLIVCPLRLDECSVEVKWLMTKYADQPMDLADACLVHLYSTYREGTARIVTLDRKDFTVYRTRKGRRIACVFPPE